MHATGSLRAALVAGAAALAGCEQPLPEPPADPSADGAVDATLAFTIVDATPATGAVEVPREAAIEVRFSRAVATDSVTASSFRVEDERGEEVDGTREVVDDVVRFTPASALGMLRSYAVELTTGLTAVDGVPLSAPVSWTFTVRDGAWDDPFLLRTTTTTGDTIPRLAVDGSGAAIAVWSEPATAWARHFHPATGWDDDVVQLDAGGAIAPPWVVYAAGHAVAAWKVTRDDVASVAARSYAADGGWSGVAPISGAATIVADLHVAIDGAGSATVVWAQAGRKALWSNRHLPGAGWTGAAVAYTTPGDVYGPRVAADREGNAIASFAWTNGSQGFVRATRRTAAGQWSPEAKLDSPTTTSQYTRAPQVAFDHAGNALAVWSETDGSSSRDDIWVNRFTSDGWGTPARIEDDDAGTARSPQVAFDPQGNAIVVWRHRDGQGTFQLRSSRFDAASGTWGAAEVLATGAAGSVATHQIAIGDDGRGVLVWSVASTIWAIRWIDGAWGQPVRLDVDGEAARLAAGGIDAVSPPQVGIDADGNAIVTWAHASNSETRLWAVRFH